MNRLGKEAEQFVVSYLKRQNYTILETNWTCKIGEVDIIVKDEQELVFIEVKALKNTAHFDPMDHVTPQKINKLRQLAQSYTSCWVEDIDQRIDIVLVYCDTTPWKLDHFKDAIEN